MTGIGEIVTPLANPLPELFAVLVNPQAPVPHDKTARVFRTLGAPRIEGGPPAQHQNVDVSLAGIGTLMTQEGNDLAAPAMRTIPDIEIVLEALRSIPDALRAAPCQARAPRPSRFSEIMQKHAARLPACAQINQRGGLL